MRGVTRHDKESEQSWDFGTVLRLGPQSEMVAWDEKPVCQGKSDEVMCDVSLGPLAGKGSILRDASGKIDPSDFPNGPGFVRFIQ